jgi:hypothetical protein
MTRHQRAQFNKEQFRNKTKSMSKRREVKDNRENVYVEEE